MVSIFLDQFRSSSSPDPITRLLELVVLHSAARNGSPTSGEVSGTSRPLSRVSKMFFSRLKAWFEYLPSPRRRRELKNMDSIRSPG